MIEILSLPELALVKTYIYHCAQCHSWIVRVPQFDYDLGKGHTCHKCGCTSVNITEGRPFGPRSTRWSLCIDIFNGCWNAFSDGDDREWLLSTVEIKQATAGAAL